MSAQPERWHLLALSFFAGFLVGIFSERDFFPVRHYVRIWFNSSKIVGLDR